MPEQEGTKHDRDKLRVDLIPPAALEALAQVYTIGARKYGDHNWRKGIAWNRIYGAALRHLLAWAQGRSIDPEDGQHPLASVAWCCFTLMEYERLGLGKDDRQLSEEAIAFGDTVRGVTITPEERADLMRRIMEERDGLTT